MATIPIPIPVNITISEPVSAIVSAASNVVVAILAFSQAHYMSMTPEGKVAQDRIQNQIYWDWRELLKRVGIVGEPIPWPPPKT